MQHARHIRIRLAASLAGLCVYTYGVAVAAPMSPPTIPFAESNCDRSMNAVWALCSGPTQPGPKVVCSDQTGGPLAIRIGGKVCTVSPYREYLL